MKVYILIMNTAVEYDETVSVIGTFTSRKQARKELRHEVEDFCSQDEDEDMVIGIDTPDHFEAYHDGYAAESHFYLTVIESEVTPSPAGRYKARTFFGEAISDAIGNGDMKEAKRILADGDGEYIERVFTTEAERQAYYLGMEDNDGWMGSYPLDDDEKIPRWVKNAQ